MEFVFASNNFHKINEIQQLVPFTVKGLQDIGCVTDIPETALTIEGNALLKAQYVYQNYNTNCFSDDSGLEVEALNGAPGVYSARYAGEPQNSEANIDKLLSEMQGVTNRKARFKTVITLIYNHKTYYFTGIINGTLLHQRQGNGGFGYDSIFVPEGYDQSFAELTSSEKNRISHRGQAVAQLVAFLNNI